jgi:hypothetical protein
MIHLHEQRSYRDEELTFCVHTFRDIVPLAWVLSTLRKHYPAARVIIVSDGDSDARIGELAEHFRAECHYGERLYDLECGGRMMDRMVALFLERPTPYLFKIDTDTSFQRRFRGLPVKEGLFGTLQVISTLCSIQGGCTGITLGSARKLHESGIFRDAALVDYEKTWAADPWLLDYVRRRKMICTDWVVGYAATCLDLAMFGHPEIRSDWRKAVSDSTHQYAVVHPVKLPKDVNRFTISKSADGQGHSRYQVRFFSDAPKPS